MLKSAWPIEEPVPHWFGPNSLRIELLLAKARHLDRENIARLDMLERADHDGLIRAWDAARFRLRAEPYKSWLRAARITAWATVAEAARAEGFAAPIDNGYWRVAGGFGYGAARAACLAAAALVGSDLLDAASRRDLLGPWQAVVGVG